MYGLQKNDGIEKRILFSHYKCPQCSNRFTIRDAEVMDAMQEQGIFQLGRVSGIVIYDNNKKLIYARRKRKNENDL